MNEAKVATNQNQVPQLSAKFEPQLAISDLTGGLNTKFRPNKIADNQLQSLISFDFYANSLRRSLGYTKLGTEPDPTLVGKNLYCHTALGNFDMLVKTVGQYLKFYDPVDDTWYKTTVSTFTANLKWSFVSFNGYLYGVNGTDWWMMWNANARSTLKGAITAGGTVITLQTGHGARFPATGIKKVMIQDEEIPYTNVVGDTLTGCTITQNHASGSTVILENDAAFDTSLFIASRIEFHKNRIIGIDAANPNIVRHSKLATNSNPQLALVNFTVTGSGAGDAGYQFAPKEIRSLKVYSASSQLSTTQSSLCTAFCRDGTIYSFVILDDATAGTTVAAFSPIRPIASYPISAQMVAVAENDILFIDQYGHLRALQFPDVASPLSIESLSKLIEPSLEVMTWDDGAISYWKRKLRITGKSPNASSDDITFFHDSNYDAWGAYGHIDAVSYAECNGLLYALSAVTGNVWQLENGYDANGGPYYSEAITKDYNFGQPHIYKSMLFLRMTGYITQNCPVYIDLFFDGSEQPVTFLLSGDNTSILGPSPNVATGSVVFGKGVFGGGLPNGVTRREFTAHLQINFLPIFLKFNMRIRIDSQNVDFEMNDATFWARLEGSNTWKKAAALAVN